MGLFDALKIGIATAYGITAPVPKDGKSPRKRPEKPIPNVVATAYGITAPVPAIANTIKELAVDDKKLCRHCGAEIGLEYKYCPKCGKKLGYLKENESQDWDELE